MLLFVQGSNRFSGKFLMFAGLKSIENGLFYLYLFIAFVCLGLVIALLNFLTKKKNRKRIQEDTPDIPASDNSTVQAQALTDNPKQQGYVRPEGCCGMHEVCEKDSLLSESPEIIYFADEELDAYKGREAFDHKSEEIAEFEDVLLTLKESEVSEWLKSLQLRGIVPPQSIMDEALMIVSERRANSVND